MLVKGAAETADEVRTAVTLTAADQAADQAAVTSTAADDDQDQAAAATESTDAAEATEPVSASRCSSRDLNWARACLELMLRFHGMPFVDLANLRKVDLQDGYLTVRRHKTGAPLLIAVDPAAMKLLRLYASKDPSSPLPCLTFSTLGFWARSAYLDLPSMPCACSICVWGSFRGSAGWAIRFLPILRVTRGPLLPSHAGFLLQ